MTKKDKLLNEQTIRRWAKLADVSVINENFFDDEEETTTDTEETVTEDETVDEEAHEGGEEEGDMDVEMDMGEADDAEGMDVVQAVLKALEPFGVEMEEDDAGEEMEAGEEDAAMKYNVDDKKYNVDDKKYNVDDPAMDHGMGDYGNRQDEALDLEVVDDEALTEAVLKRVLKRILSNK